MSEAHDEEIVDYAGWGERFFEYAVTTERVLAGVNVLAGRPIDVGPLGVGPGRIAKVRAQGAIGTATGQRIAARPAGFAVTLPVDLEFAIEFGLNTQRFEADIQVPLTITALACADLSITLDVAPPKPHQVVIDLQAQSIRASITQYAAGVEGELKRFVAKYVAREIDKPYVAAARRIDVSGAIDRAMSSLGPRSSTGTALTEDLPVALETEINEVAGRLIDEEGLPE